MTPHGHTLRQLHRMALGKAELLGGTKGGNKQVAPYDPSLLARLQ